MDLCLYTLINERCKQPILSKMSDNSQSEEERHPYAMKKVIT